MPNLIFLTPNAVSHFKQLLQNEDEILNIRMNVENPGTINADLGITFCPLGENQINDVTIEYDDFKVFLEQNSVPYLQDAIIDYVENNLGGELTVKAPLIRGQLPDPNLSLAERVNFVLSKYINPGLASHGGQVSLVMITNENIVRLQFGGGCQGCGMAQVTLKNSVEKTLLHYCNDIFKIEDITEHDKGSNPYF
jgi:Fe/S biogenesis protein NfuA